MTDVKTSALPAASSMAATDQFVIISDYATTPATKRIPQTTAIPFTTTPTADKIPQADGAGKIDLNWVVDYKNLWIGGWRPTLTNGCGAVAQLEMGTNKNVYDYVPFDAGTVEYAYANVPMPLDYDGGAITYKCYWTHPSGTAYKVLWGMNAAAITDNESLDVAAGSAVYSTDEGGTANLYISDISPEMTIGGTASAGKLVHFEVFRVATSPTDDTLNVDAYLIGVLIKYGVA